MYKIFIFAILIIAFKFIPKTTGVVLKKEDELYVAYSKNALAKATNFIMPNDRVRLFVISKNNVLVTDILGK